MSKTPASYDVLRLMQFWLGFNALLFIVVLLLKFLLPAAVTTVTPRDVLFTLLLSGVGLMVGLWYQNFWAIPPKQSFQSITRVAFLSVPSVGAALALQLLLQLHIPPILSFSLMVYLASYLQIKPEK